MSESFDDVLRSLASADERPRGYSRSFVRLLPVSGASVSSLGDLLGSETLSASDATAARLDEVQFDLSEGPCWDAMRGRRAVLLPDARSENVRTNWPSFWEAIADQNVGSLFAFPVVVGTLQIGAVDLYSVDKVSLDQAQAAQATALADAIGRSVLRSRLRAIGQLEPEQGTAFSRRLVHQATGMVLAQLDLSADDARLVIQGHAFAEGRTMMEVAQDVLDGRLTFSQSTGGIEASQ